MSRLSGAFTAVMPSTLLSRSGPTGSPKPLTADDNVLWELGSGRSDSGITITPERALTYSPLWRAVVLIASDVAKLPLVVYRRDGEGKQRATNHPAYRLLKHKAHDLLTAYRLKQTITADALMHGNGYGRIMRNGSAGPAGILRLDPAGTHPIFENGRLWYLTQTGADDRITENFTRTAPRDMLHIRGFGDGIEGHSLIDKARDSLGLGISLRKYVSVYFRQGARPSIVLEHPSKLGDAAARHLRESWNKIHEGVEAFHRPAILEEGMKINPFGVTNEDSQFLQTRQFEIREVSNWTGVPPHKLGDTTRTSFSSLLEENQSYLNEALDPWLVNWETECWDKLLSEAQKRADSHLIEFTRQALLEADLGARGDFYNKALAGAPFMTINEVRSRENMNPREEGASLKFPVNNFGDGGDGAAQTDAAGDGGDDSVGGAATATVEDDNNREAIRRLVADAVKRMTKRLSSHAQKAAKQPDAFVDWVLEGTMRAEHEPVVVEVFGPVAAVARCDTHAMTGQFFDVVYEALDDATHALPDELPGRVRSVMDELIETAPNFIAGRVLANNSEGKDDGGTNEDSD